ncbi:TetR/AcrR family transcriptional regulator [Saccharibacillus sacchari]|uniref:TetR family transcriptional regulator n=1 Tax=Saccharibacillus sacchari TaxID=456493 RepID=A0ACC6PGR0_9BACL
MTEPIPASSSAAGLRERKKKMAEQAITEAALHLFNEKGYHGTSVQEIADAVTMSSRTFFRYFDSKEDILSGMIRSIQQEGLTQANELPTETTVREGLRLIFLHLAGLYERQREGLLVRYRIAKQSPALASLFLYATMETEPELCQALALRLKPESLHMDLRFLVALHMTALRVTIEDWLEQDEESSLTASLERRLVF